MNRQLPWISIGGVLILLGIGAIATHMLPVELGLPPILVGGGCIGLGLQTKGANFSKVPIWVAWAAVALALVAFFYFTGTRRA